MLETKYIILFSACFIGGLYLRHWVNTGTGQLQRFNQIFK